MKLDFSTAAGIRDVIAAKNEARLRETHFDEITLGAIIELACTDVSWEMRTAPTWKVWYTTLCSRFHDLDLATRALRASSRNSSLAVPRRDIPVEIHCLRAREDFEGNGWIAFQENFVKRAQACGFSRDFAYALAGAFVEIAENVPDHSAARGTPMAPALIGYHIVPNEVHFAVGDIGRGAFESLRENSRWDGLENSRQALEAILWSHATRKADHEQGGGFNQVWKSFLDRNGTVAVHSGDAYARALVITGARQQNTGFRAFLPGFRVCASCVLKGLPGETGLKSS